MKNLFRFGLIFCATLLRAQLPTLGLVAQYDMLTTGGGGTTLTDLSGAGNTGTLHGTTTNTLGRIFNGTTDYVSMPILIQNSDFTAIMLATTAASTGACWGESNAAISQIVRFGCIASSFTAVTGSSGPVNLANAPAMPNKSPDWDIFFMDRSGNQINGGMFTRVNRQVTNGSNTIGTVTTTGGGAGLGALNAGGSQVNFWTGTMGYFLLYNRQLTAQEKQNAYSYIQTQVISRPIFFHPWPNSIMPIYTNPVWQRLGTVLKVTGVNIQEPTALYDVNCQIVVATNCLKLWFTYTAGTVGYAESSLSPIAFTAYGSNPVISASNCHQPTVVKVAITYHLYCANSTIQIDHWSSTNGTSWTLANSAVIVRGSAGAWDANQVVNPGALYNPDGTGTWYMLYGANALSGPWGDGFYRTGGATSPDGITWTKITANPIVGMADEFSPTTALTQGGPSLGYVNGIWYDWDELIGRFASPTFNGLWIWNQPHLSLLNSAFNENSYAADPTVIEANRQSYMFYAANDGNGDVGVIKAVFAPMPLSQLVTTSEGVTTDWP
jgi:hypothetical protein